MVIIKNKFVIVALACFMLTGCDEVSESDRLIYVKPAEVSRAVLIEDFTGQRCINCPNAADEISRLQEEYGEDKVIAVGTAVRWLCTAMLRLWGCAPLLATSTTTIGTSRHGPQAWLTAKGHR